jgi:hypothetical protein
MGAELIVGIIGAVLAVITIALKFLNSKVENRKDLGKAEADELKEGMDKVDAIYAATPDPPAGPGVQPKN